MLIALKLNTQIANKEMNKPSISTGLDCIDWIFSSLCYKSKIFCVVIRTTKVYRKRKKSCYNYSPCPVLNSSFSARYHKLSIIMLKRKVAHSDR